jgi:hypothetical protein
MRKGMAAFKALTQEFMYKSSSIEVNVRFLAEK